MSPLNFKSRLSRPAVILVGVLWMLVLMTLIISVVAQNARLDMKLSRIVAAEDIRCKWAIRAGIETAIACLEEDDPTVDSLDEIWSDEVVDANEPWLKSCKFDVEIVDESSKLNVNIATKDQLLQLPNMTDDIADSILDWRDRNDKVRDKGAEEEYYLNLDFGYPIRNGAIRSVRELLLVKGVTPSLLYRGLDEDGYEDSRYVEVKGWLEYLTCYTYTTDKTADDESKVNINKADQNTLKKEFELTDSQAKWIVDNRGKGLSSFADLIKDGGSSSIDLSAVFRIADKAVLADNGVQRPKVNVNTAGLVVLTAILEGDSDTAEDIYDYVLESGWGLTSLEDVCEIESLTTDAARKLVDNLTVNSSVFCINCKASPLSGARKTVAQAIVDRSKDPIEIIYYRQGVDN
jgi:general secretion pathway protein K